MENTIEDFCNFKDYKLVLKRLRPADSFSRSTVNDFIQFVKEKRMKRKSASLSFEIFSSCSNTELIFR